MSTKRRLSSDESKARAIAAARTLLIEEGPQAVTLKAVADQVGRTHANLLHHFGSAAGLQRELASDLAQSVCDRVRDTVMGFRAGSNTPRDVVDMIFDAFDREGGGALASWMLLSGNHDALDPIVDTVHAMVDELYPEELRGEAPPTLHRLTYSLCLLALGEAMMGPRLSKSLNVDRSTSREHAEQLVLAKLAKTGRIKD